MPIQVIVVPHSPDWARMFQVEAAGIAVALGSNALGIHHIGSTAIAGALAKPIIQYLAD